MNTPWDRTWGQGRRLSGDALTPLRITLAYAVFGLAALYVSDVFLPSELSGRLLAQVQAIKGAVEVVMTAGLIYALTAYSQRELRRTNRRLEEFASVVSHDLRNPLNVIEGSLELAESTGEPEHFERCRRSIERMRRLIEDLLALAREGEVVGEPEPVDLSEAAETAWTTALTGDAELAIETDAVVAADPDRLRQLLGNLFRNAAEHGGRAPTVTVGDHGDGFFVADDGSGIPPEDRDRVFRAGYSTDSDGTGFGLHIVETVADAHGWDVVATEGPDGGGALRVPRRRVPVNAAVGRRCPDGVPEADTGTTPPVSCPGPGDPAGGPLSPGSSRRRSPRSPPRAAPRWPR